MTATREFVEAWAQGRPPADDWIYVFDFEAPSTPRPIRLPAGTGRRFKSAVEEMIPALARELAAAFGSESYQRQATTLRAQNDAQIQSQLDRARSGRERGAPVDHQHAARRGHRRDRRRRQPDADQHAAAEQRSQLEERSRPLIERMAEINRDAARFQRQFFETLRGFQSRRCGARHRRIVGGLARSISTRSRS